MSVFRFLNLKNMLILLYFQILLFCIKTRNASNVKLKWRNSWGWDSDVEFYPRIRSALESHLMYFIKYSVIVFTIICQLNPVNSILSREIRFSNMYISLILFYVLLKNIDCVYLLESLIEAVLLTTRIFVWNLNKNIIFFFFLPENCHSKSNEQ